MTSQTTTRTDLLPGRLSGLWSAPHVMIWTLRRCGATTLSSLFWETYEPNRFFTDAFAADKPLGGVGAELAEEARYLDFYHPVARHLYSAPSVVRQNVEHMSKKQSSLLLASSLLNHSAHIILYRRDELARLRSLSISLSTGYWGHEQLQEYKEKISNGTVSPAAVEVTPLLASSQHGINQLRRIRSALSALDEPYVELCTEDLFGRDSAKTLQSLRDGLAWHGLEYNVEDMSNRLKTAFGTRRSNRGLVKLAVGVDRLDELALNLPELRDARPLVQGGRGRQRTVLGSQESPETGAAAEVA